MTGVTFRAAAPGGFGNVPTGKAQVVIPATVQAGDIMLMAYGANANAGDAGGQGVIVDPAGWTPYAAQSSLPSFIGKAWYKIASSGDAGTTISVQFATDTVNQWGGLSLVAYSGASSSAPVPVISSVGTSTTSSPTHVMPTIDTSSFDQSMIVSVWFGREAASSTSYGLSAGWTSRAQNIHGVAGENPNSVWLDSGSPVPSGTGKGGATVTGDQPAINNVMFTVAIAPAATTVTKRPVTDVTVTNWTPSMVLGGGVQDASLLADNLDSTFLTSSTAPTALVHENLIDTPALPPDSVRNRFAFGGGAVSGSIKTELRQGASTSIASRTDTFSAGGTPCPTTPTDITLTLTGTQKSAITDLTDLRIRTTVTAA